MFIVPYIVIECMLAITAVIGNAFVIFAFHREPKLRRRTNFYVISLAIADLLVGLLGIPFAIMVGIKLNFFHHASLVTWSRFKVSVGMPRNNVKTCLLTVSSLVGICTTAIFCIVAISIDRFWVWKTWYFKIIFWSFVKSLGQKKLLSLKSGIMKWR